MSRTAACSAPTASSQPQLHDPATRVPVLDVGGWEVRALRRGTPQFQRLRRCDGLHVQLWNPQSRVSVLTPSALTQGRFEVCRFGDRPLPVAKPPLLHGIVAGVCATPLPAMREIALFAAWFKQGGGSQPERRGGERAEQMRRSRAARLRQRSSSGDPERRIPLPEFDDGVASDPLRDCEPDTLRLLLLFLAVADPAFLLPFAAPAADARRAGARLCGQVAPAFAAALNSAAVRREIDRRLATVFAARARGFRSLCLADLAQAWGSHLRTDGDGSWLAAFLWAVARRPEGCFRKLEAKVRAHIEESRQRLLLDVEGFFVLEGEG